LSLGKDKPLSTELSHDLRYSEIGRGVGNTGAVAETGEAPSPEPDMSMTALDQGNSQNRKGLMGNTVHVTLEQAWEHSD
jgi:hypothetical protein